MKDGKNIVIKVVIGVVAVILLMYLILALTR